MANDSFVIVKFEKLYENIIMIKPKQQVHKQKNPTTRKPSLPLKRNSSIHSNASDQSCMSDRIIYKKNVNIAD